MIKVSDEIQKFLDEHNLEIVRIGQLEAKENYLHSSLSGHLMTSFRTSFESLKEHAVEIIVKEKEAWRQIYQCDVLDMIQQKKRIVVRIKSNKFKTYLSSITIYDKKLRYLLGNSASLWSAEDFEILTKDNKPVFEE